MEHPHNIHQRGFPDMRLQLPSFQMAKPQECSYISNIISTGVHQGVRPDEDTLGLGIFQKFRASPETTKLLAFLFRMRTIRRT